MHMLLCLSGALMAGLILTRVVRLVQLPDVTAYLLAGILMGPYVLGALDIPGLGFNSMEQIETYGLLSDLALGFIAFSIGNEFRLSDLKHIGRQAAVVGVAQAVVTTLLVDMALIGLHFLMPDKLPLPAAIILGAVASATAPAATLMVVRQYKAKGPLTDILLPIVALDDAVGLVLFAVSFGVAKALISGRVDLLSVILEPLLEVVLSLALGALLGALFNYSERFYHSRSKRQAVSVTFVMLAVGLSMLEFEVGGIHVAFSSLLTCMMLGTVFCNMCDFSLELMARMDRWTAPLYVLFFVLSGAELELSVFRDAYVVIIGLVYVTMRCLGKYYGASLSSRLVGCSPNIVKYLGITLFPQAGVALGMAMKAETLGAEGAIVANITLFSVLIYELVGPALTREALKNAGEITGGATSARGEVIHFHWRQRNPHHK
jgi:Kef-type K+ transport system membrane component KefB